MVVQTKHTGKNLQQLRETNKKMIVRLLRKGDFSGKEISDALKLSPAGVQGLVDEMVADGLLVKKPSLNVIRGRRPIDISINPNIGIVAIIRFEDSETYDIDICNFGSEILKTVKRTRVDGDLSKLLVADLHNFIEKIGMKLYAIAFMAAGKVRRDTGAFHYAPSMEEYEKINFKTYLEKEFSVPVIVKNKMIYLLHAERKLNASINLQNVLYVNGLGAALCIDGRIFEGTNGFVGELGMILTDTYGALNENDYWNPYRSNYFTSVYLGLPQAVKNIIGTELTHEQIFEMYNNGAENVRLSVETFLHLFALVIRNIAGFMDLSHVIIGGPMAKLNDKAFALISTYINSGIIDKMDVQILRATAGRTDLKGAFEFAMDLSFEELLGSENNNEKGKMDMEQP